ncbi:MAG: hypothetical protein U1F87_08140, partial [Kiritimatiellia bacterium]
GPEPKQYTYIAKSELSNEYTDEMLFAKANADLRKITSVEMQWSQGIQLNRPMPWKLLPNSSEYGFDPSATVGAAGYAAVRKTLHHVAEDEDSPVVGIQLQQMAVQLTTTAVIPPDHLLRTILLEIHRNHADAILNPGQITKIMPKEVFLKPGSPVATSMELEFPPPVEEGTVEVRNAFMDLTLKHVDEQHEELPGDKVCVGISVPFTAELLHPWNQLPIRYRLHYDRPEGSDALVRNVNQNNAPIASGTEISVEMGTLEITPDVPGEYSIRVEIQSALPHDATNPPMLVDRIVIHATPAPELCADYDRDGKIDAADAQTRDTPVGPMQEPRRLILWVNDDDDEGPGDPGLPSGSPGDDSLASGRYNASLNDLPYAVAQMDGGKALSRQNRTRDCDGYNNDRGISRIDGMRDLLDLFPIHLVLPLKDYPSPEFTYRLRTTSAGSLGFAYSKVAAGNVGCVHTDPAMEVYDTEFVTWGPGSGGALPFQYATLHTADSSDLLSEWMLNQGGVIYIEGRNTNANEQLILEILDPASGSRVVGRAQLPLQISNAHEMMRYINVREASELYRDQNGQALAVERPNTDLQKPARTGALETNTDEPSGLPDGYYHPAGAGSLKTIVMIHGADWDEVETPAGMVEVFKRLHQSGRTLGLSG